MADPTAGKRGTISTFRELVSTLCDFLTVTFHTILFEREIYPPELFIRARKYEFPVRQSRHPRVCKWIQDAVEACSQEILKGTVSRVSLIIISPKNAPLERYVFDFSLFPSVPLAANYDDQILQEGEGDQREEISLANLEEQFRVCLLRLSVCTPKLGRLPEDCTYTVAVEMKEPGAPANVGYFRRWLRILADILTPVR